MNRFQDRRMVKKSGGGGGGAILVFQGEEGFALKQAKFGDDFPLTNWSLGGIFIYTIINTYTYMTEIFDLKKLHPAALNFKMKFAICSIQPLSSLT